MIRDSRETRLSDNAKSIGEHIQSENRSLEDILSPERKYCFLAGSGISIDPPSCLPTGQEFTEALLKRCIPESKYEEIRKLMNSEREGLRNTGDFLRFEELMEYLSQSVDPELHVLDDYANCQTPNIDHQFLAQMIIQGRPVLTTNFDSLIEIALLEAGVQQNQLCPMILRQDWEASHNDEVRIVHKLHGSLIDMRTKRSCRESIQATLKQISQGKNDVLQLEPWKRVVLEKLLINYDLVVLGYSGLDDFDLVPTLLNISSDKNIIWINFYKGFSPEEAQLNFLGEPGSLLYDKQTEQDRVWRLLSRFSQSGSRLPKNIIRIDLDTSQLWKWLWTRFLQTAPPSIKAEPAVSKSTTPALTLSEIDQWTLAGQIYHDRNLLSESLHAYQTALVIADAEGDPKKMGPCFIGVGHLLHKLAKTEDAQKSNLRGLKVARACKDLTTIAIMLNEIGMDHFNQGRNDEADKELQQALEVAKQLADRRWEARTLNNWGLLVAGQGNFKKAKELYDEAIAINDQLGDLRAKNTNFSNLAQISQAQHHYEDAINKHRQVIELADQLGDLMKKAMALNNIGQILEKQGKKTEARKHYEQALQISEKFDMPHVKLACLFSLAELHYQLRQMDEALAYSQRLLEIPDQLQDSPAKVSLAKASLLARMGVIYHYKKRMAESRQAFEEALVLYKKFDQPAGKCTALTNYAFLLDDMGEKSKAIQMLKEARALAKMLGDPGLINYVMDMQRRVIMGG